MLSSNVCRYLIGFFCLCFIGFGCTLKSVDTRETGSSDQGAPRILIAYQQSKFKHALVADIRTALQKKQYYIKIIDVKALRNESVQNYHAVVIINKCMAGRPDPRVEDYILEVPQKDKIILLTTGYMDAWKPESPEVDAMTSASKLAESNRIAQIITGKVTYLIDSKKM